MEEWKVVNGYGNKYLVSNHGRVTSLHGKFPRILKPGKHRQGYLLVVLQNKRERKTVQVHRLVLITFVGLDASKCEVNHIDGKKDNNILENLEWVSPSENVQHSFYVLDRDVRLGELVHNSKLSDSDVHKICGMISEGISRDIIISKFSNLSQRLYYSIRSRQNWKHISHLYKW